jgi:hypothetical protein
MAENRELLSLNVVPRQNSVRSRKCNVLTVKNELAHLTHEAPESYENEGRLHFGLAQVC